MVLENAEDTFAFVEWTFGVVKTWKSHSVHGNAVELWKSFHAHELDTFFVSDDRTEQRAAWIRWSGIHFGWHMFGWMTILYDPLFPITLMFM